MESRKVSVVIPTYNRAYCLATTIGSLQAQTYPHWEALVIDDGSRDNTAELMRSLAAADPRIKYHPQKNAGVSAARNAGLRLADGEFAAFLDSDDAWEPWKLSAQIACFDHLPDIGMVWTDMNAFDVDGHLVSPRHLRKMYSAYEKSGEGQLFKHRQKLSEFAPAVSSAHAELADAVVYWGDIYTYMMYGNHVHTSTVLLSRQRLRAVGFFEESYKTGEDYDFHLRTCAEGPVALLDAPCIRYRIAGGEDQLTSPKHQLEIARNGLRIREAALARNRTRIEMSDAEIGKIIAGANAWVAHELFEQGNFEEARRYFRRGGLLAEPNATTLLKASISHLPPALAGSVMALIRKAKGKLKATGATG